MYERMLDKSHKPTFMEMVEYCAINGKLFESINEYITNQYETKTEIRFPYGNHYGWGISHKQKNKYICDIFPEKDAFTVMMRLTNKQIDRVYVELEPYSKELCDNKYPCKEGGWIHYRVINDEYMNDILKLLCAKFQK